MSKETVIYGKATHIIALNTRATLGGSFIAPDAAPTVTNVHINGAVASDAPITITQLQDSTPANLTGRYQASLDLTAAGFDSQVNDVITIDFESTIAGSKVGQTVVLSIDAQGTDKPSLEAQ